MSTSFVVLVLVLAFWLWACSTLTIILVIDAKLKSIELSALKRRLDQYEDELKSKPDNREVA